MKKLSAFLGFLIGCFLFSQATLQVVASSHNDVEINSNTNTANFISSDLELAGKDGTIPQECFVRFEGIALPSDAVINSVYLVFYGKEASSNGTVINITGEVGSSAVYPASTAAATGIAIKGRNYTSSAVSWTTTTCVVGQQYQSPDLKGLIQQMFPEGLKGINANLAFRFVGNGQGAFTVYSRDGSAAYAPKIVISYWTGSGTSSVLVSTSNNDAQQTLTGGTVSLTGTSLHLGGINTNPVTNALRFDNVQIPATAQITDAYIEFYSYGTSATGAELTFVSELGNPAVYTTANQNITSRTYSERRVIWNTTPWTTANTKYRTPNLKEIVDENRLAGWQSGQALAFDVNGNGATANVWSRDGSTTYQPRLVVEYLNNGAGPSVGAIPSENTISVYVVNTNNNATQNLLTGSVSLNALPMSLGGGATGSPRINTIKFDKVQIPSDATITDAYIQFYTYGAAAGIGSNPIVINSEIGNPSVYTTAVNNLTARNYSVNQVTMNTNPEGFPLTTIKPFRTPNLSTIIDENRLAGWEQGQSLAFKFESLPESAAALNVYSRGSESYQPKLVITYQRGGSPVKQNPPIVDNGVVPYYKGYPYSAGNYNIAVENKNTGAVTVNGTLNFTTAATSYVNGVRFENIQIPQGAKIDSAWIEIYSTVRNTAKIKILGELGNAPAYSTGNSNLTQRNFTTIFNEWDAVPVVGSPYSHYDTPNLKNIINQNILNGTWQSGQALAFKFETLSGGAITAFGNAGQYQPRLNIILSAGSPQIDDIVSDPVKMGKLYINEVSPVGSAAQSEDWIELYNDNDFPVYFKSNNSGIYVSTKTANLTAKKLTELNNLYIPAHGFLVLIADENPEKGNDHLSFDLSNDGTDVYLFKVVNGTATTLDHVAYSGIPYNSSYGRVTDGTGDFVAFIQPTYNATNANGKQTLTVAFSKNRGVYPTGFDLAINAPAGTTVKYTLDGQYPSETIGTLYTAPIPITKTTVVKTYVYNSIGNSGVIANTYVLQDNYKNEKAGSNSQWQYKNNITADEYAQALAQVPVISLSANPGRATNLQNYTPFTTTWQQVSVEYLDQHTYPADANNHPNFFSNSLTKIFGQASATWFNCGIKFKFNSDAGVKKPSYPFFDAYPEDAYPTPTKTHVIELKEGEDGAQSNAYSLGYMRFSEKLTMNLQKQMGKYALDTRWVHFFVNGQYRGIRTMRNDFSPKNLQEVFGDDNDNYTEVNLKDAYFTGGYVEAGDGLQSVWNNIVSLANANNLQGFKNKVDILDLIKFQIMFMFIDCENEAEAIVHNDAPQYLKAIFNINDTDGAFWGGIQPGPSSNVAMISRTLAGGGGNYKYKWISNRNSRNGPNGFFGRFSGLSAQPMDTIARVNPALGNLEFKTLIKDQILKSIGQASGNYQGAEGAPLSVANVKKEMTNAVAQLDLIYKLDAAYMATNPVYNGGRATRYSDWKNIDYPRILAQIPERTSFTLKYWKHFGLTHTLSPAVINTGSAIDNNTSITIDNPNANTQLYYATDGSDPMGNDGVVSPKAQLYSKEFTLPVGNYTLVTRAFTTNNWGPLSYQAVTVTPPSAGNFVITGINYKPKSNGDAEFLLITNAGNATLDVSGYNISDAFKYTFPQGTTIAANQTIMLAKDLSLITGFDSMPKYQWTSGSLSNDGEPITFINTNGNVVDNVTYGTASPWNPLANGKGYYLKLRSTDLDNALGESWDVALLDDYATSDATTIKAIDNNNLSGKAKFTMYPNPASSELHIDIDNNPANSQTQVYIYNVMGQLEITTTLTNNKNILNVSYLKSGYYMVKIVNSAGVNTTYKLIKL
jgi:hypothetical protein